MIAAIVLAVSIPIFFVYCYKNAYKRPPNFPPGPPSLPLYGSLYFILLKEISNLAEAFIKLAKSYKTSIIGYTLGPVTAVVLNDPADIKAMLNNEDCDGRMDIFLFRLRSYWKKLGVFFTDGYFWHVQRRFSLRFMRDYGFGRRDSSLEATISNDIRDMLDMRLNGVKHPAEKEIVDGELIYLPHYFAVPFINGILYVLEKNALPRSEYDQLWTMAKGALLFQRNSNDLGGCLSLTPWIKDFIPEYSGYKPLRRGNQTLLDYFEKLVKDAMETYDESYDRHFIDVYIRQMKKDIEEKGKSTYSVDQLVLICTDYMFPSATAVQSTLTMLVERLLLQPELQENIHEEIDRVVGRDRLPTLDDRRNMPYTEACLREIMRFETLVPLGVPHRVMKDIKIGGYDIPQDTMISGNLVTLHMDKGLWGDPENFRPERFIENGQLNVAKDKSLPFGAGRRLCAGETYARQSMFQVFSAFMQAFDVATADGKPLKTPAKRIQGIITTLPNFWVRVTPRV